MIVNKNLRLSDSVNLSSSSARGMYLLLCDNVLATSLEGDPPFSVSEAPIRAAFLFFPQVSVAYNLQKGCPAWIAKGAEPQN